MEYYGYQKRKDNFQVDWGQIGQELSKGIGGAIEDREKRKQEIEKSTQENLRKIQNSPAGRHNGARQLGLDVANQAKPFLLAAKRAFQDGRMGESDYVQLNNRIVGDVNDLYDVLDIYHEKYGELLDKSDKLSEASLQDMERLEAFGQLNGVTPVLSENGGLAYGRYNDKNELVGPMYTAKQFESILFTPFEKFNLSEWTKKKSENIGEFVTTGITDEFITTITDPRLLEDASPETKEKYKVFDDMVGTFADEIISNTYEGVSMLMDIIDRNENGEYTTTDDIDEFENDKTGTKIFVNVTPNGRKSYEFQDSQKEAIKKQVRESIVAAVGSQTKMTERRPQPRASSFEQKLGGYAKEVENDITRLREFFESNDDQKRSNVLATYSGVLKDRYDGFESAEVVGDNILIRTKNKYGEELIERLPIPDNFEDFVLTVGPDLTGNRNLLSLYERSVSNLGFDPNELKKGVGGGSYKIEQLIPFDEANEEAQVSVGAIGFINDDSRNKDFFKAINQFFTNMGVSDFSADIDGDNLTISAGGVTETVDISFYNDTRVQDFESAKRKIYNVLRSGVASSISTQKTEETTPASGDEIFGN